MVRPERRSHGALSCLQNTVIKAACGGGGGGAEWCCWCRWRFLRMQTRRLPAQRRPASYTACMARLGPAHLRHGWWPLLPATATWHHPPGPTWHTLRVGGREGGGRGGRGDLLFSSRRGRADPDRRATGGRPPLRTLRCTSPSPSPSPSSGWTHCQAETEQGEDQRVVGLCRDRRHRQDPLAVPCWIPSVPREPRLCPMRRLDHARCDRLAAPRGRPAPLFANGGGALSLPTGSALFSRL